MKDEIDQAQALLERADTIVVIGHERPDGVAVGSLNAVAIGLENTGKQVRELRISGGMGSVWRGGG